jgi:hypothetical protein
MKRLANILLTSSVLCWFVYELLGKDMRSFERFVNVALLVFGLFLLVLIARPLLGG